MVTLISLENSHIPYIWGILADYPNFFRDESRISSYKEFEDYFNNRPGLIAIKDGAIVGCAYIEDMHDRMACVAFLVKKRSFKPKETVKLIKDFMPYFFEKFDIDMIYAITKASHKAALRLWKKIGFTDFKVLPNYQEVNGVPTDYILAGIHKRKVTGGI